MKDWKMCQYIYHSMMDEHSDNLGEWDLYTVDGEYLFLKDDYPYYTQLDITVDKAIEYLVESKDTMHYPAKSYAVALVYATLLEKYFDEDFYEALSDKDLLYGNDDEFVPYGDDDGVYQRILDGLPDDYLQHIERNASGVMNRTIDYFYKEFLLEGELSIYSPDTPKRSILVRV